MNLCKRIFTVILAFVLCAGVITLDASAKSHSITTHVAVVTASSLRLRSGPSTASSVVATAPKGDYVIITGKTGAWYHVTHNLKQGYMHQDYLTTYTVKNVELGYGTVTGSKVNLRSGPGTTYSSIDQLSLGETAYIIGFNKQWYKVTHGNLVGYIRSDYLKLTPKVITRQKIVEEAKKYLGVPYLWGGTSPTGFDCSGFTQYVLSRCGISIPRTTTEQYNVGSYIHKNMLQPGDLVFLQNTYRAGISHVGIYIGNDQMIHASSSKGVVISNLSGAYYTEHYYGARQLPI